MSVRRTRPGTTTHVECDIGALTGPAAGLLGHTHSAAIMADRFTMHVNALGAGEVEAVERLTARFGRFAAAGELALAEARARLGLPPAEWRRCPVCDLRRLVPQGDDPRCPDGCPEVTHGTP